MATYDKIGKSECHCPDKPISLDSDMSLLNDILLRESVCQCRGLSKPQVYRS
jgi:hypothetical protein